jgi:GntR family transcriptional regulator / MocR family aminotransferase
MDIALSLDPKSPLALYRQIYDGLREGILTGRFEAGSRLPATRSLAVSLGVSRITVTECYDRLISEGYLETRQGSGTFVCARLPETSMYPISKDGNEVTPQLQDERVYRLSRYGSTVNLPLLSPVAPSMIRFDLYGTDVATFPKRLWTRLFARRMQEESGNLLRYTQHYSGQPELRIAIAQYLKQSRAVVCDPNQIVIVSGSQQAISLAARILLDESDYVAMENPGYRLAWRVFSSQGAKILPIPVDEDGIQIAQLRKQADKAPKLVYLTPSHQYPLGVALSVARRIELLEWARETNTPILEDDYDSEFRYSERPLASIQGMVPDGPVLYTGTFSKLLFPALRLGYLVVPSALQNAFTTAKLLCDLQSSALDQQVLADFLLDGHLEPYVRKMRIVYGGRRVLLIDCLRKHFGDKVTIRGDDAGLHFVADFKSSLSEDDAFERALQKGVRLERVFWTGGAAEKRPGHIQFVFTFAGLKEEELILAAQRLADAFC